MRWEGVNSETKLVLRSASPVVCCFAREDAGNVEMLVDVIATLSKERTPE